MENAGKSLFEKLKTTSKNETSDNICKLSEMLKLNTKIRTAERKIIAFVDGEISDEEYEKAVAERLELKKKLNRFQHEQQQ